MNRITICIAISAAAAFGAGLLFGLHKLDFAVAAAIAAIISAAVAVRYTRRQRQSVGLMLGAVRNHDTTLRLHGDGSVIDAQLNEIAEILHDVRRQAYESECTYSTIFNRISAAVLVVDNAGFVRMINNAALRLFGVEVMPHLDTLARVDPRLPILLGNATHGSRINFSLPPSAELVITTTLEEIAGEPMKIFLADNIGAELQQAETESWVKLTRVLIHEITNSLTPIVSIARTLTDEHALSQEHQRGIDTIGLTARNLMEFVESFRTFSHTPQARPEPIELLPFLTAQIEAAQATISDGIRISLSVKPRDLMIYADPGMTARVITNIINNAAAALTDSENGSVMEGSEITITAGCDDAENVLIDIANNGEQISADNTSRIFTPFFSTRSNGQGIGLALCKQLMRAQSATITLLPYTHSPLTTFRLTFP